MADWPTALDHCRATPIAISVSGTTSVGRGSLVGIYDSDVTATIEQFVQTSVSARHKPILLDCENIMRIYNVSVSARFSLFVRFVSCYIAFDLYTHGITLPH